MKKHKYEIDYERFPRRAKMRQDGIEKMLGLFHVLGYQLTKVDYNSGMIQMSRREYTFNLYTTTFTITVETPSNGRYPNQVHYKNRTWEQVKEIITEPEKYKKQ